MTAVAIPSPLPLFVDLDGKPLTQGRVYIGEPNENPETNPLTVYWDAAGTQPAAQPLRTKGGYVARSGTPAAVFAPTDYSITVRNRYGSLVYYLASSLEFSGSSQLEQQIIQLEGRTVRVVNSMTALRALLKTGPSVHAYLTGYYSATSGGGGHFTYVASDTTTADNGGTVIVAADGGRWYRDFTGPVHAEWFGYVADADPSTHVSAGGYGVGNVTALNNAITAAWLNKNYSPNVTGGGYGGQVILPPGYGQLAGSLPVVIPPAISLVGAEQYVSVLCCTATYRPQVTMADGNTLDVGAIYFNVSDFPYLSVPGYPTMVRGIALLSKNSGGPGIVVNSNTATIRDCWVAGWLGPGIVLQNTNTLVEGGVSELNGAGLLFAPFCFGNTVDGMQFNNQLTGVFVANRKWYDVNALGNSGGANPVVVLDANQGINTGYTFQGGVNPAADFTGYRVTVMNGTGKGQTGIVTATALSGVNWRFTLTIASDSGAWVATDATSKVVVFNANLENTLTNCKGLTHSYCHLFISEAYKFQCTDLGCSQVTTLPSNGAVYVESSEGVEITGIGASAAIDHRQASTTLNGIIVGPNNKTIKINGGLVSGWANGIFQGAGCITEGLTITGVTCTGNSNTGLRIDDGGTTTITGGSFSNNGRTGVPGTGIALATPNANTHIVCAGALVDPYINGAVGNQGTGISVVAGANSRIVLQGNSVLNHTVANYTFSGPAGTIETDTNVLRTSPTIASFTTITIPPGYEYGGTVFVSGTTTIVTITPVVGGRVTLIFQGALLVSDGGTIALAGPFNTGPDDTLTLICDGTTWREVSRSNN